MIKVDGNSKVIQKIKTARSLKDLASILKKLTSDALLHSQQTDELLDSVSGKSVQISLSARKSIEVNNLPSGPTKGKRGPSIIEGFKPPSLKELVRDSKSLAIFAQQIAELETLKRTMFSDNFANLPNTKALIKSTEKTIKETKAARDKQLKAMTLAINTKPKEVKRFSGIVSKAIQSSISEDLYSKFSQKSFILHPNKSSLWYQTYLILNDFSILDDYIVDEFIFVVTSVVHLETGLFDNHLTLIKDSKIPGSFEIGPAVETDSKMKRYLNALLSSEDYKNSKMRTKSLKKTRFPTTKALKEKTKILEASEFVSNVRVHLDRIFFTLVPGVDKAEINEALLALKAAMNILYSENTRGTSTIKYKIERSLAKDTVIIIFALTPSKSPEEKLQLHLETLTSQMGLDKATARKLKSSLVRAG